MTQYTYSIRIYLGKDRQNATQWQLDMQQ
jgi:hypothetical protein